MDLIQGLMSQFTTGTTLQHISQQIGAGEDQTGKAISAAVPMLISALARNSSNPEGASALHQALDRDHDGGILDDLAGFLNDPSVGNGSGILGHVLGDRRGAVESGLAQATGLKSDTMGQVLEMLAPVIMGALGRTQRNQGLDSNGLAGLLGEQRQAAQSAGPDVLGLVTQFLDADKDGNVLDDLANMAGKLFSKK